jgi:hypothetical protein
MQERWGILATWLLSGIRSFVSLLNKIPAKDRKFLDVWSTITATQGVYFSAAQALYYWDHHTIITIPENC